jgi:hypothetical protein
MFSTMKLFTMTGIPAVVTALLLASPATVSAAPILYDFEDQPIGTVTPLTMTESGLSATFAGPSAIDPGAFQISFNSSSGPFPAPYRTMDDTFLTVGPAFGAPGATLTITFSAPVSALSLLFALDDPANATSLSLSTNAGGADDATGTLTRGFFSPEGVLSFSGDPFTTVTLSSNALDFQIDNVEATAVPEPSQLALLAAGLGMLAFVRRAARR